MKTARWMAMVLPILCVLVVPTWAIAEGWGLPSWNPFAGDDKPSAKATENSWKTGKKSDSSFASRRSAPEPSMWDKMSSGTSSAWKKTTTTLTPWKKKQHSTPARATGARKKATKPAPKTTWYNPTTWMSKNDSPPPASSNQKTGSVSEFLNQPRVPY